MTIEYQNKTDVELINLIKNQSDNEAFLEICNRYEKIFYKVCQKYLSKLNCIGVSADDIFDEKNTIIYHCINTFEPKKKTKLGTWVGNYARYLCLNSINARKFIYPMSDEDIKEKIENINPHYDNYSHSDNIKDDFNYAIDILNQLEDKRILKIFKFRYLKDKKYIWSDIAKELNLSPQMVINLHEKGINFLNKKFKNRKI